METRENAMEFGSIERDVCREAITAECAVDHTLPDYMPEIRKLRRIDARPIPSGKYVGDRGTEFSGIVAYTVIYTDGEGALSAVTVNGDYTFTAHGDAAATPVGAYADVEVDSTVCRLGGPRSLTLRSTLRARAHAVGATPVPTPQLEGCEVVHRPRPARRTLLAESGEIPFYDAISVPGLLPDALHPLFTDGSFRPTECRATADGVTVVGFADLRIVAKDGDGRPMSFSSHIPLEREVALPGAEPTDLPLVCGHITALNVRALGDGEGGCRLEVDGAAECRVRIAKNGEISPILACYSPTHRTEVTRERLPCEHVLGSVSTSYTVSGSSGSLGEETAASILDTSVVAAVRKVTEDGGRAVVLGDVKVGLLLAGLPAEEGAVTPCFSVEFTYPFRLVSELAIPAGCDVTYECRVDAVGARARLEEGGYAADTELRLLLTAYSASPLTMVSSVTAYPEERYPARCGTVTVVYPEAGDDLFSIAERYHTTPGALAEINSLPLGEGAFADDPALLDGISYLIVE